MLEQFKTSLNYRVNLLYIGLQGMYWMMVCCCVSLGSAYLSNRGYSTFSVGVLFAMAYLLATLVQQIVSVVTDSSAEFDVLDVLAVFGVVLVITLFISLFTHGNSFLTGFTFLMAALVVTVIQPFLNALNFYIERMGIEMNYGVARASGSFCFFIMSLVAGFFMKIISEKTAPFLGFFTAIGFTLFIVWIFRELKEAGLRNNSYDPFERDSSDSFQSLYFGNFIEEHKMFFLYLIGLVCFYFGHVIVNNFMYQISVNVGGDEGTNGGLLALQAIVELPAMIFFNRLKERFNTKLLLGVSSVFYFVKIYFTAIATSVAMLYFSMIFQAFAFAIFIPASVHLVDEIMSKQDAVKGQAFVTMAMTLSSLIASIFGGLIINIFGVTATLWLSTFITVVGVAISIYALFRINTQKV